MANRIRGRVDQLFIKTRHVGMGPKAKVMRTATGMIRPTEGARGGGTQEYYFEVPVEKAGFDLFDEVTFQIEKQKTTGGGKMQGVAVNIKKT